MSDANPGEEATLFPKTAGERLREAREAQGLSLAEIAARTRIPIRQLEAIETSNFAVLPSITYSVGFAKAYARAVGANEADIARDVRSQNGQVVRRPEFEAYEMPDPSRTPSRGMALAGLGVAVLLLVAVGLWYGTSLFRGEDSAPAAAPSEIAAAPTPAPVATPVPAASDQVSLTATDEVWLRIYDATGKTLFQGTLQPGGRYDVPTDANGPMINVGRPDKLQVTLNGSNIAPLGNGQRAIKDVGISAMALNARASLGTEGAAGATPAATPAAPSGATPAAAPVTTKPATTTVSTPRPARDRPRPATVTGPPAPVVTPPPAAASTPAPAATAAP